MGTQRRNRGSIGLALSGPGNDPEERAERADGGVGQVVGVGASVRGDLAGGLLSPNVGMSDSFHRIIVSWHISHSAEPLSRAGVVAMSP